jgi:phytoene dehydrogenase-like protein
MCVADWLGETFGTEALRVALALPGVAGTWTGPWSAGTAGLLLLDLARRGRAVSGGPAAITDVVARAARNAGAECRIQTTVRRIRLEGGRVAGVELADGEVLSAPTVVATCTPRRTFGELLGPREIPDRLARRIAAFRSRGTTAKVHLALDAPLVFAGRPDERPERLVLAESIDGIERSFDNVKYGELPAVPTLDVWIPTLDDPTLAPSGGHVASILVHFVPHALRAGWSADTREQLRERVLSTLSRYAPDVEQHVVGCEVLTPADIEQRYGLTGGQIHHGEHALDQLLHLRPTPECSRYATPIEGLYLGGSGSHPGGGISGAPGRLAARAVLG